MKLFSYRQTPTYQFKTSESHIEVLNFWNDATGNELWMHHFIRYRLGSLLSREKTLMLASVFGPREHIRQSPATVKIFFSGENTRRFKAYKDHCLKDVDLSLGMEYIDHEKFIRFPLWLTYFFPANFTQKKVQQTLDDIMSGIRANLANKQKFCALICSHDKNGIRSKMMKTLSSIEAVDSAGRYRNNTTDLKIKFNDDKHVFLQQYKFNICPENSDVNGYVTEKIFQAIAAGSIPVYWGCNNNPEPEVLNQNALLFYHKRNVTGLVQQVTDLHQNHKQYLEFAAQNRFTLHAAEFIAEIMNSAAEKIRKALG